MKKVFVLLLVLALTLNITVIRAAADDGKSTVEAEKAKKMSEQKKVAVPNANDVERMSKLIKSKIDIPADYEEFTSEANSWPIRLRWGTKTDGYFVSGGSTEVTVNEDGGIVSYYHYTYERNYDYQRKLPKISKEKAVEIAKKFINYICPEIIDQIDFNPKDIGCTIEFEGNYRLSFIRQYKNIPFYEDGVSIGINGITGEIRDFNRTWKEGIKFPDSSKVMSMSSAQSAYIEKIPFGLRYGRQYDENNKTYLQYMPSSIDINSSIDAVTGEKVVESQANSLYNESKNRLELLREQTYGYSREIYLTQDKLNELVKNEGLISAVDAEKLVRDMGELGIDNACTLSRSSYSSYTNSDKYLIRLEFIKPMSKEGVTGDYTDEKLKVLMASGAAGTLVVTLDAKTSELDSVNAYNNYPVNNGGANYNRSNMQGIIDEFLKKYKSGKYDQLIPDNNSTAISEYIMKYRGGYPGGENNFIYVRKVNGIPFDDNQIIIGYDSNTGKINFYTEMWDPITFTDSDNVIGESKAAEVILKYNPLQLRYASEQNTGIIKLVYGPSPRIPICVDAVKGVVINYFNNDVFKVQGNVQYKDIEGSSSKEQINALAEAGLLSGDDYFRPKDKILQKEWLYMIYKMRNGYGIAGDSGKLKQQEMDSMYRMFITEGIFDENEKNPDMKITREQAVKYLLDSAGYKKFAALEGIFNCDYKDKNNIDPKLIGYVSIARALKLLDTNSANFLPKEELSREDAAVLIYNYMKR